MTSVANKVLSDALALSDADRADLVVQLIDSLEMHVDEDAPALWAQEIVRRKNEVLDGAVEMMSWPEARRMIMGDGYGDSTG